MEEIRKGPWKEEEDEVLLNHVKHYGPREWSSIKSKGLLQRTGKSCRLRYVNKLRPNLKKGYKFSVEEERIVIELQAEIGNKWARIATYLQGRTDNDVKNFWSSRQKRHARRILHNSGCDNDASSSKDSSSHRVKFKPLLPQDFGLAKQENTASSSWKMIPYTSNDQVELDFKLNHHQPFSFGTDLVLTETTTTTCLFSDSSQQQPNVPFSPESMELLARLDDPHFYDDILGGPPDDSSEPPLFALPQPFFEPSPPPRRCSGHDGFLDDFPTNMFDQVDPVPSP